MRRVDTQYSGRLFRPARRHEAGAMLRIGSSSVVLKEICRACRPPDVRARGAAAPCSARWGGDRRRLALRPAAGTAPCVIARGGCRGSGPRDPGRHSCPYATGDAGACALPFLRGARRRRAVPWLPRFGRAAPGDVRSCCGCAGRRARRGPRHRTAGRQCRPDVTARTWRGRCGITDPDAPCPEHWIVAVALRGPRSPRPARP